MWERVAKLYQAGPAGKSGHHVQCLDDFPLLFSPPLALWSSAKAFVGLFPNKKKKNLISLIPVLNFEGAVMDHSSYFSFSADTPRNSLHSLDDHRPGVLTPASREQSRLTCTPCCSCQPPDAWADPHTCKGSNRSQAPGPHRGIWNSPKFHPWELLYSPHSGVWHD